MCALNLELCDLLAEHKKHPYDQPDGQTPWGYLCKYERAATFNLRVTNKRNFIPAEKNQGK